MSDLRIFGEAIDDNKARLIYEKERSNIIIANQKNIINKIKYDINLM